MPRILLLATTTGYQTRAFGDAAEHLGLDLVFATDRCHMIEDPWQDEAIAIRFYDESASVDAILAAARTSPVDGVLVVGDRPTVIAARVNQALGLPGHPPEAVAIARSKQLTREALRGAGLPTPWFAVAAVDADPATLAHGVTFPCVVKPRGLSGSRGVIRADTPAAFCDAFNRLRAILRSPDVRAERTELHEAVVVEGFIPGREYAVEALLHHGSLVVLAIFDKPDPLDGPFFEETIYLTPSAAPPALQAALTAAIRSAVRAIGLHHGPIHAECRVSEEGVFVLEVAARPIGGLCARTLAFSRIVDRESQLSTPDRRIPNPESRVPFEELLLRHALGESPAGWEREPAASGVMMIPIPHHGIFRGVSGVDDARGVAGIDDVRITAKPDQLLVPLPEGASYLGFIFARGLAPAPVERALRAAHERLEFTIEKQMPMLQSPHG